MNHGHGKLLGALLVALLCAPAALAESPVYDELPDNRVLYIAPGQSLFTLVQRLYPDQPARWSEIRGWIVDNNPHAFVGGDPSRLRADVRVQLPAASDLAAADPYRPRPVDAASQGVDDLSFGERYVFVDPAQSLNELVPRLYPEQRDRWQQIVEAILERNAQRLAGMDSDKRITRGTRLQIPRVPRSPAPRGESEGDETSGAVGDPPGPVVAEVVSREGALQALDAADRERPLAPGDPVRRGDTLRTGDNGRAEIEFRDGERLFLRPDSRVRVRDWRLPDTGPGTRVVELLEGGLRAITGAIGNRDADTYRTVSPQATLGVRGTQYSLRVCARDECRLGGDDAAALNEGLYVGVTRGRVSLLNETGETEVQAGDLRYVAGPTTAPASADADVVDVLYTEAEQAAVGSDVVAGASGEPSAQEEDGSNWGWVILGIVLLGVAL